VLYSFCRQTMGSLSINFLAHLCTTYKPISGKLCLTNTAGLFAFLFHLSCHFFLHLPCHGQLLSLFTSCSPSNFITSIPEFHFTMFSHNTLLTLHMPLRPSLKKRQQKYRTYIFKSTNDGYL